MKTAMINLKSNRLQKAYSIDMLSLSCDLSGFHFEHDITPFYGDTESKNRRLRC